MKIIVKCIARWIIAVSILEIAINIRTPLYFKFRSFDTLMVMAICLFLGARTIFVIFKAKPEIFRLTEQVAFFLMITMISLITIKAEAQFYYKKYRVLNTPQNQLQDLGRHFIVGYKDYDEIKRLVSKGAVGGIYITRRNVQGKSFEEVQKEIQDLQKVQKSLGMPPLFIAADQEGGIVSRMTPPLKGLPPISYIMDSNICFIDIEKEVTRYAAAQGDELARLGINVNFSPVVDLKSQNIPDRFDSHTQLDKRAISFDQVIVYKAGLSYCKTLEKYGVFPTLKHFPGLSRVAEDTHFYAGELNDHPEFLDNKDWLPFREISKRTNAFIMLGHVRLNKVDSKNLTSFSSKVIQGTIRGRWKYDGILITDDLNMGAIVKSKPGIKGVAVKSLNAGVDLLLISYDGAQYYEAMYAVIKADNSKTLDYAILAKSDHRLEKIKLK